MSEAAADEMGHSLHNIEELPTIQRRSSDPMPELTQEDSVRDILLQMKKLQENSSREHLLQIRQLLVQEDTTGDFPAKAFDWVSCKPGRLYHPVRICQVCSTKSEKLTKSRIGGCNPSKTHPICIKRNKQKTSPSAKTSGDI